MDSRDSISSDGKLDNRPILTIDLNEIPSPPSETPVPTPTEIPDDALSVVQNYFHHNVPAAHGPPADFPGEPGVGLAVPCGLCGRPESRCATLVCDGCERGFHLSCIRLRPRQVVGVEDWVCGDCVKGGAQSQRWPLGAVCAGPKRGGVRNLDINALPPNDADGEGIEELNNGGLHTSGVDTFSGISSSVQMPSSNLGCAENGFDLGNEPGTAMSTGKSGLEEILAHGLATSRSFEDTVLRTPLRDEKKFNSMLDVGRYLGIMPNCSSIDIEDGNDGLALVQKGLPIRRRRRKESARHSRINSFIDNQDSVRSNCDGEFSSDVEIIEPPSCDFKSNRRFTEAGPQENGSSGSQSHQLNIDLPVQYEDFFLLCLGEVDLRPSYHNSTQIWPVGYRSSWHDKITGSFFNCEVSDGGNGPVFKVRRCPCSASPIPNGSTVLSHPNISKDDAKERAENEDIAIAMDYEGYDEENDIQMILSDHSPLQLDVSSCLRSSLPETCHGSFMQAMDNLPAQFNCLPEKAGELMHSNSVLKDEIGEFLVEGRSSSSVWTLLSHTLIDACREVYKHSGSLQFFCKHDADGTYSDATNARVEDNVGSVSRFHKSSGPIDIPRVIQSDDELETSCEALRKWLDQDRFGLDMDFVQEIIEQLPGAQACSQYEFLDKRSYYSSSQTVGSGRLLAKRRRDHEDTSSGLSRECKRSRKQDVAEHREPDERSLPPGRPLSTRLPAELVGDVFEVWELLGRFYEILGLKEPLLFEELEQELIDPWFDGSNFLEKLEKEIQEGRETRDVNVQRTDSSGYCTLSHTSEENSPTFIQVETGSTKDAAQARVASRTYGRCTGVTLTKAHTSLLKVLVAELQSKVAAFVDPNFDAGESKPRRGRKKDVDNSTPPKKSKIDILPVNELTWPELARRYILSVIAMDGNLDSTEIANRESGRVYRCLQGDGGVLCGSLAGVAGMEADALLLAEAEKQISDFVKREDEVWPTEYKDSEAPSAYDTIMVNGSNIPEWAQLLEPVRKLPTNVGTRIRKCIFDALEKGPPEWARKILEHSISKEVYKGNASGPTKKAVLAVLAEVCGESLQQKPSKGRKEKIVSSTSDIIMKQCRIILRRAAAADDGKVFCNLLGTTLLNPNDNEDEGILGSPAMVSRPLDFRTIDLRLAVGAYGGSHEAFLEDVREVWHHISTAYGDRSDLMRLAETLSQDFESLYDKEVLSLVQKCAEDPDPENLSASVQKELDDVLVSASEIPKAPWEEGVCKVCGIDRDDDSVLLCDTCDSEYHTYCLNPPLARIPEGNWYCPSCVAGQGKAQVAPKHMVINRHRRKRYQGEDTRILSEALNQLAATMEEKEYWELSIEERTFLLKFLCNEALSSVVVRDHLDRCADMSAEMQQKLRSLAMEWRTLKFREDLLTARNTKDIMGKFNGIGEAAREGMPTIFVNNGRWMGHPQFLSNRPTYYATIPGDLQQRTCTNIDSSPVENGPNDVNKQLGQFYMKNTLEKYFNSKSHTGDHYEPLNMKLEDAETQMKAGPVMDKSSVLASLFSPMTSSQDKSGTLQEQPLSISLQQGGSEFNRERLVFSAECGDVQTRQPGIENSFQSNMNGNHVSSVERNVSVVPMLEVVPGSCHLSDIAKVHLVEHTLPVPTGSTITMSSVDNLFLVRHDNVRPDVTESKQACDFELHSLRNDISKLQDSISGIESQLPKVSLRRDFLGRDSYGRLYWGLCKPGKHPWLVIDGSIPVQAKRRRLNNGREEEPFTGHSVGSALFSRDIHPEASKASSPRDSELNDGIWSSIGWVSCESDAEIQQLAGWLNASDSRERELKESILHWQRLGSQQSRGHVHDDLQTTAPKSSNSDKAAATHCLATKAAAVLEKRYGSCLETETNEIPKKKGRKGKASHEERMYRCECLEPVWPSRYHCLSCHQTFCTSIELEGHNDGRCSSGFVGPDESKENESAREGKGMRSETTREKEHPDEADAAEVSKGGKLDFSSRLVKFQKKDVACPYDIEEIGSKFVTKNSNKELVKEIGLLGSNGNPSFIPSTPAYFLDPTLLMIRPKGDEANPILELAIPEEHPPAFTPQGIDDSTKPCHDDHMSGGGPSIDISSQRCVENGIDPEAQKTQGCTSECMNDREPVSVLDSSMGELEVGQSCTVPETSLRPLVGKVSQILRRLKINLLDMDAALPEEALKPSKAHVSKRCAWRAFLKSAESIYEMVQAMIVFENMLKTEYLRNGWWYWSSLTAAAKTSSVTSLALRIYALDAAIIYQKTPPSSDPIVNPKAGKTGKKRKDVEKKETEKKDADG
ncbi:methyl-CpG-binding domain-containing protein 9 isoform X2 [Magnolia sinica]|uniref:methyl-CpG-binding domain-containing protein 9 isoform X2 n=1 Tax=Magnolia sinica TaxID=86752 RepID=UPI00265AD993|nr:methyl-CpG-binding domain-containing protein 9 isoform X2 [Magnolia sinica]